MKLSEGLKNSRMERAEAQTQAPPVGQIQPPPQSSAPPAGGAPAPAPAGNPAPVGPQGMPEAGNKPTSFVDYVVATLHDSETFSQHVEMIKQGPQGAAQVAVGIGTAAVQEHQQRGITPTEDEQAQALEIVLDDVVDIGMAEGALPKNKEQAEFDIAQIALPMWAQAMGQDPAQLAQEIASDATPEDQAAAEKMHQSSALNNSQAPV